MAENKNSFILYGDISKTVSKLPRDVKGDLFQLILDYVNDLDPVIENNLILEIAFEPIKQQLKRDLSKWGEIRIKRSEAGQKSAEIKKQQKSTKSTSVECVEQTSTKSTVNVNVNDSVSVNVNEKKVKDKNVAFAPPSCVEVENYFLENNYTQESGRRAWHYYQTANWRDSRDKPVKNWKQKMQGVWFKEENKQIQHQQEIKSIYTPPINRG